MTAALFVGLLVPTGAAASSNWPAYLFNAAHASRNGAAKAITRTNAASLLKRWTFTPVHHTGRPSALLYGSPVVYNGRIYIGSHDGWFYELDEATGAVLHSVDTGYVRACASNSDGNGTTSTATVAADTARGTNAATVYVTGGSPAGGSGIYLYALDADDLHPIWSTDPVTVDTQPGAEAWSSPTLSGKNIYTGISSQCDDPLVRGGVVSFARSTGAHLHTFWTMPVGAVGGSVWTSVAVANGSVWATTGNADEMTPNAPAGLSYSMVKLSPTLAQQAVWTVPGDFGAQQDYDFGGSPTAFTETSNGVTTPMIGACDKDGLYYAFGAKTLSNGPAWTFRIGNPSSYPPFDACLSAAVWDSTAKQLIIGGNSVDAIDGQAWQGSVRALSPLESAPSRVLWDNGLSCNVIGTPTENGSGIVAVATWGVCQSGGTPALYLLDARHPAPNSAGNPDAPVLSTIPLGSATFAQPTFADNMMFVATSANGLRAYAPPG